MEIIISAIKSTMVKVEQKKFLEKYDLIKKAVRYSGLKVWKGARDKVPVVTGNLRDSIVINTERENLAAFITSNVIYAEEQEYNTIYNHDHEGQKNPNATWGFFRKSLAEEEPLFKSRIHEIMRK